MQEIIKLNEIDSKDPLAQLKASNTGIKDLLKSKA